jgi:dolichyl-phosphate beta-glucosyltransferase
MLEQSVDYLILVGTISMILLIHFIFTPALYANQILPHSEDKHRNQKDNRKKYLLTIVIPAYNESQRLNIMLKDTMEFLQQNAKELRQEILQHDLHGDYDTKTPFCIVIVNDGSIDDTVSRAKEFLESNEYSKISYDIQSLPQNRGKGAAVKRGMMDSYEHSHFLLMADADGATNFASIMDLFKSMFQYASHSSSSLLLLPVVFGSRAHLSNESKAKRSRIRTWLMQAFHFFVKALCSSKIHDTQCGFKLFPSKTVPLLFQNLHLERWAFDTELVVIAERLGITIEEVAVEWHEVDGSKLNTSKFSLVLNSICMLRDMICVRICYSLGYWKLKR